MSCKFGAYLGELTTLVALVSGSGIGYWFYLTFLNKDTKYEKLMKGIGLKNKLDQYPLFKRCEDTKKWYEAIFYIARRIKQL